MYSTGEFSTWVDGQTTIPVLKHLIKGTTFLDWARPGLIQTVKMKNTLSQEVYVLQRIHVMFMVADMSAAIASMASTVISGGLKALFRGAVKEGGLRAAVKAAGEWQDWFEKKVVAEYQKSVKGEITVPAALGNIVVATAEKGKSLNGDLNTLINAIYGENSVFDRVTNAQSALSDNDPLTRELVGQIKKKAQLIKPGETKVIADNNYIESAIAFSGTNKPPEDFLDKVGNLLQAVNIMGPSGWAGQVGFPTVHMYVMTEDAKKLAHMTTAPNISWNVKKDRIVSIADGNTENEGLGYYLWSATPYGDLTLQAYNRQAYNALESIGFDRGAATTILIKLRELLQNAIPDVDTTAIAVTAAQTFLGPSFRKLLWLNYTNGEQGSGTVAAENATYWALRDANWAVGNFPEGATLEQLATYRLEKDHPKNVNDDDMAKYEACLSATYYGLTFQDAHYAFRQFEQSFQFGGTNIWHLAAPTGTGKDRQASLYVEITAALNGRIKNHATTGGPASVTGHKLVAAIAKLGTAHGRDTSKLLAWWNSNKDLPKDILAGLEA